MKRKIRPLFALYSVFPVALALGEDAVPKANSEEPVEELSAFVVMAGRIPTGTSPGALLNSIEVVSTPGATADINRSLQTFPGVQQVDEGNALFVRGGDSNETVTVVNGIRYPAATRLAAPTGSFSGSLDPMQAKTITFLNGGMSAQYGNALSGVVDLTTRAAPNSTSAVANVALGAIGLTENVALGHRAGFRATAVQSNTAPILGLNGTSRDYLDKPHGHDWSLAPAWNYSPSGELRAYALDQENQVGLMVDQPSLHGVYRSRVHSQLGTLSWSDQFGAWKWNANAGRSSLWRTEAIGDSTFVTGNRQNQADILATVDVSGRMAVAAGAEVTQGDFTLEKSKTEAGQFLAYRRDLEETRCGAFVQADAVVARHVRAIVGGRIDRSTLTEATTADPRVSLAWEPGKDFSLSLASGSYHQVPDAYHFVANDGSRLVRPALRAQDAVVAVEYRHGSELFRVEGYQKRYGQLAQLDRNYLVVPIGGTGRANGADLFFKTELPAEFSGRLTYSFVNAERTDPNTGQMARAPWDVTHSVSLILERAIGGWHTSVGWRYASGRPITPVLGGIADGQGGWTPVYGDAYSDRVRVFQRVDFLAYRVWFVNTQWSFTTYLSINNLLNRTNVYAYSYSPDYSQRRDVPSLFNRVVYFGAMIYFN